MTILPAVRATMMVMLLVALFMTGMTMKVFADKGDLTPVNAGSGKKVIEVTLGKGDVLSINGDVSDVLVANPAVADVSALQSNKLYIVGMNLGDTNLVIVDSMGNILESLDIHVKLDEVTIQNYLSELYPEEQVKVKALNDQVILTGSVSNPSIANKITRVVAAYIGELQNMEGSADDIIVNLLQVRGEQQVMLKVKIFEASKKLLKELAIETEINAFGTKAGNFSDSFLNVDNGTGLTEPSYAMGGLVFETSNFGPAALLLSALETDNSVRTLAEPNLTAISGEQAGFLAGGEFPVPGGRDDQGNVIIEFRSFGVSLNFRPTVMSENRISLNLQTEVSSLARDESVTIAGLDVPGLNIRRASTTVEVPSGGGMMIGGLLEANAVKGMAGLPGIRDIPVLGDLVSSRSFIRDESELVILITAYLVKPYAENPAGDPGKPSEKRQPAPVEESHNYLEETFANNIRRIYGRKAPTLLDEGGKFGYLTY